MPKTYKNIFVVFTSSADISNPDSDFFSEWIKINDEMTLDEIESLVKNTLLLFNSTELKRYGDKARFRGLKWENAIVWYIPFSTTNRHNNYPDKYGEYNSFDEIPDFVLKYCSNNMKTLSLYEVHKFDNDEKVFLTM